MSTIDDINAQKDAALAILDQKILDAAGLRNDGKPGMGDVLATLKTQRQAVFDTALDAALNSAELTAALATIKAATGDMTKVAARMVIATDYVSNIASFGTAASKVVSALKGGG